MSNTKARKLHFIEADDGGVEYLLSLSYRVRADLIAMWNNHKNRTPQESERFYRALYRNFKTCDELVALLRPHVDTTGPWSEYEAFSPHSDKVLDLGPTLSQKVEQDT